ncbi:hypothetical protein [Mangrovicoccus ximenensis]|nr:hypothetical protein [Mangrovicoccus ximenensis]
MALPDGARLKLTAPPNAPVATGDEVGIAVDLDHAWIMPEVAA